jgi:hypothetical protein
VVDVRWKVPRVDEIINTLDRIDRAMAVLEVGDVFCELPNGSRAQWQDGTRTVRNALRAARTQVEEDLGRTTARESKCD